MGYSKQSPGEGALVAAIIAQAYQDAFEDDYKTDAINYFKGDMYLDHLGWLGLPSDWLPVHLARIDI